MRLFKEKRQGLSFARNLAVQKAEGELLVFLDDDAIVDRNYLSSYWKYYQESNLLCLGSKILPWHKNEAIRIPPWFNKTNWGVLSMLDMGEKIKEVTYPKFPYGGNLAVTKKLFLEFGFFDEAMGRKGKNLNSNMEIEFMRRLQEAHIPIYYVPDAIIYHLVQPERMNRRFFLKRFYAQGKSDVYLFNKEEGIKFILKSLSKRLFECLCAPMLFVYRKAIKREDYFKPILRMFYDLGFFAETLKLMSRPLRLFWN
jgi:GT2 family glycosyltransferase